MTNSTEEKKKNIYQRVIEVMENVEYIQKQDSNNGMRYKFVSHDSVMAALHKPMAKAGIVFLHNTEFYGHNGTYHELRLICEFINADDPTDRIVVKSQIPSKFTGDEKGYGSTLSYAIKYSLLKMFMLETGEDADSSYEEDESKKKTKAFVPPPVQKTAPKPVVKVEHAPETPLYLGEKIMKLLPANIPVSFVRDQLVSIMKAKNITWENVQEEALKNMSAFLNSVDKKYHAAKETVNTAENQSKIS